MTNQRTIKELLELMLENQPSNKTGLCHWSNILFDKKIIDRYEHNLLYEYIKNNPPFLRALIARIIDKRRDYYYWRIGSIAPRIKWLKKHIKKQSK